MSRKNKYSEELEIAKKGHTLSKAGLASNIIFGIVALIISILSYSISKNQAKLTEEQKDISNAQTQIMNDQTLLAKEQEVITKRQAEIMDKQTRIQELGFAPIFNIYFSYDYYNDNVGYNINVTNTGYNCLQINLELLLKLEILYSTYSNNTSCFSYILPDSIYSWRYITPLDEYSWENPTIEERSNINNFTHSINFSIGEERYRKLRLEILSETIYDIEDIVDVPLDLGFVKPYQLINDDGTYGDFEFIIKPYLKINYISVLKESFEELYEYDDSRNIFRLLIGEQSKILENDFDNYIQLSGRDSFTEESFKIQVYNFLESVDLVK